MILKLGCHAVRTLKYLWMRHWNPMNNKKINNYCYVTVSREADAGVCDVIIVMLHFPGKLTPVSVMLSLLCYIFQGSWRRCLWCNYCYVTFSREADAGVCDVIIVTLHFPGKLTPVSVMVQVDKAEFLLCTLGYGNILQQKLELMFTEGEEVTFFLNGSGMCEVHWSILNVLVCLVLLAFPDYKKLCLLLQQCLKVFYSTFVNILSKTEAVERNANLVLMLQI